MAYNNHRTLYYCVCYPHPMSCLWHSRLVGRLASICHAPLPHPHLNSSHSHATIGMGMRVFLATWGQVCPSNSECGACCTPNLGGRGVEVDFSPTLSPRRSRPPDPTPSYGSYCPQLLPTSTRTTPPGTEADLYIKLYLFDTNTSSQPHQLGTS